MHGINSGKACDWASETPLLSGGAAARGLPYLPNYSSASGLAIATNTLDQGVSQSLLPVLGTSISVFSRQRRAQVQGPVAQAKLLAARDKLSARSPPKAHIPTQLTTSHRMLYGRDIECW